MGWTIVGGKVLVWASVHVAIELLMLLVAGTLLLGAATVSASFLP